MTMWVEMFSNPSFMSGTVDAAAMAKVGYHGSPVCMENPNIISIPKETLNYSLVYTYE